MSQIIHHLCSKGKLKGLQFEAHQRFSRIPYASAQRFCLPEAIVSWQEELDATQKPEQPFQKIAPFVSGTTQESENCLFLNIYTPACDNKKRTVMVWLYGGGFTQGSGFAALYNGGPLAEQCDVVVVTLNYRIGLLGYGYFNHLASDDFSIPENIGLHDQLCALNWVKENIESFGGNSDDITVFGQSAGAMSITALMTCPQAKGLFKRAICQSGGDVLISSKEHVAEVNNSALHKLGLDLSTLDSLYTLDAKHLTKGPDGLLHLVYPSELLPEKPLDVVLQGNAHKVDLMMGYTRHEVATPLIKQKLALLVPIISLFTTLKLHAKYEELAEMPLLAPKLKSNMDEVIAFYKSYYSAKNKKGSEAAICTAILTDAIFARPARNFLNAHSHFNANTFAYRFNWGLSLFGTTPISFHASDVPFPFNTLSAIKPSLKYSAGLGKKDYQLANLMMHCWASFAKRGDPNYGDFHEWKPYEKNAPGFMLFDKESRFASEERQEIFDFWDRFLGAYVSSTVD